MSVSVALIARDEAHRLGRCLESLRWAGEVLVVVDDRTTDATEEVAQRHGARTARRRFDNYAAQRQWAGEQVREPWVLWMDCDEVVPEALAAEIGTAVASGACAAYRLPRRDYMFGRWIRHGGWYPQYQVRLYRRDRARWEGNVHERLVVDGDTGTLREPVLHYSHHRVADWLDKMSRYTAVEAADLAASGRRIGALRLLFEPPLYFGYKWIWQQGFRDGMHGLALALLLGAYRLVRNLRWWDLQQSATGPAESEDAPPSTSRS